MKTMQKYWRVYREDLGTNALLQLIAFLLGMMIVVIINETVNEDRDFAPMGSLFAILVPAIFGVVRANTSRLLLALSMGQTRKSFLVCDTLLNAWHFLICLAISRMLYFAETSIFARLYPGFENAMPFDQVFSLPIIGLLTAAVAGLGLLFTMLKVRFGMKVFAASWGGVWLVFALGSRSVSAAKDGEPGVLAGFGKGIMELAGSLSRAGWLCIGFAIAFVLAAIGVFGLRRVEIRQSDACIIKGGIHR